MSKTLLIAKRELSAYFSTWMAYIIAAVSLFISGVLFNAYAIGDSPEFSMVILSRYFYFASGIGMAAAVMLAMRLVAEENQSGTIVLLFTSPVSERQIIYGKFLSAFLFFLFLQVVSMYMPALILIRGKISIGHVLTGYLGISLLGGAVLAISLFASTLSSNQLIAIVLSAFITVTLLLLWQVAEVVDPPFRELFDYIAIHNRRFQPFRDGIIHIKDVIFYLSLSLFSLECAVQALSSRRMQG